MRPSEEERTIVPVGESANVPLGAKFSPVRLLATTRQFWFGAAEAGSTVIAAIPPTSATVAAALRAIFPLMVFSFSTLCLRSQSRADVSGGPYPPRLRRDADVGGGTGRSNSVYSRLNPPP
ncbi:hypothetical protein SAMN02745898_104343 [Streptomyces sp. 136MFCol5.1]|nr:hypothetical protein SAMN02745898_104343 [Streptomyces sp. 136MFCol5.1]